MPEPTIETIYGRCECAAVRYGVDAPAKELYHCYCSRCRRLHGTLFATYAYVGRDHFRIEEGSENLSKYRSPLARWYFCRNCGCHLFAEHEEKPGVVWYMPATLEGESMPGHPSGSEKHIFVASKSPVDSTYVEEGGDCSLTLTGDYWVTADTLQKPGADGRALRT